MRKTEQTGKDCINLWKKEYENIPVPKAARERIAQGIRKGKETQKKTVFSFQWRKAGLTAAAVLVTFGAAVNISPAIANAMDGIPVIGSIARVVTFRNYKDQTGNMQADINVPKIGSDAIVNKDIEDYAETFIAIYEKELAETAGNAHFSVESNYEVVFDNEAYVSLAIHATITGASGAESVKVFTIDKKTEKAISLADYLGSPEKLAAVTANIKEQMKEQMKADEGVSYFPEGEEGGFTALTGTESFYPTANGDLVIVFNEYEIAPGSMGIVRFTIPKNIF